MYINIHYHHQPLSSWSVCLYRQVDFFDDECDVNFLNKITRFFTWSLKKSVVHSFFISIMERVWAITACLTLLVFEGDFAWLFGLLT